MHAFMVGPNYKELQANGAVAISAVAEQAFPALSAAVGPDTLAGVEKIFIQALSSNTDSIWIGPTGVLADGTKAVYEIPQGSSLFLPTHVLTKLKMIAGSAGQKALISYFRGVF